MNQTTRTSNRFIDTALLMLCFVSFLGYLLFSTSVHAFLAEAFRLAGKF